MKKLIIFLPILLLGLVSVMTSCDKEGFVEEMNTATITPESKFKGVGVDYASVLYCDRKYTSITPLGACQSLHDVFPTQFVKGTQVKAVVGECYAITSSKHLFGTIEGNNAIPIGEEYTLIKPISIVLGSEGETKECLVEYEERVANTYGLPEWWSTIATIDTWKEDEIVINLPSEKCSCYSEVLTLEQVTDKLKISLGENTDFRGKAPLYIRIKESYTLVYVEVK